MKTLLAYATKYGFAERCAGMLAEQLAGQVDLYNLQNRRELNLVDYDKIIIGGSVYMGKIRKEVSQFCADNLPGLLEKKVGLFICGMREEEAEQEIRDNFPAELHDKAAARGFFGGEFIFDRMNFMEKIIVKKVAKTSQDISEAREKNIAEFARIMNEA
ncbi:MAG: flavodoxin domain-containing protein [Halanaerobium sp.]|nr:flavodoxin domain-containing protein [Halanaerobium sp.]